MDTHVPCGREKRDLLSFCFSRLPVSFLSRAFVVGGGTFQPTTLPALAEGRGPAGSLADAMMGLRSGIEGSCNSCSSFFSSAELSPSPRSVAATAAAWSMA